MTSQSYEGMTIRQRIWKFTTEFEGIEKKREAKIKTRSGQMNYSYFTIDDVYNAAVPLMDECGICAIDTIQTLSDEQGRYQALVIELSCKEGKDSIRSEVQLPNGQDMRVFGSALTYLRRYTLCTMLNIRVPGEDDDAMSQALEKSKAEPGGVTERNLKKINDLIEETGSDKADVINFIGTNYGLTSFDVLSKNQAQTLIRMLERKKADK